MYEKHLCVRVLFSRAATLRKFYRPTPASQFYPCERECVNSSVLFSRHLCATAEIEVSPSPSSFSLPLLSASSLQRKSLRGDWDPCIFFFLSHFSPRSAVIITAQATYHQRRIITSRTQIPLRPFARNHKYTRRRKVVSLVDFPFFALLVSYKRNCNNKQLSPPPSSSLFHLLVHICPLLCILFILLVLHPLCNPLTLFLQSRHMFTSDIYNLRPHNRF